MTTQTDPETAALDALLREAAEVDPQVPPALTARVLADAQALQPAAPGLHKTAAWDAFDRLRSTIGGWRGAGGLVAATCAGFWFGISPPADLPDAGAILLGVDTTEQVQPEATLGGFGWDMEEG